VEEDMSMRRRIAIIGLLSFSILAWGLTGWAKKPPAPPAGVLFIGNSYTYYNNLPEVFMKLAQAGGAGKVETAMVAPGGWRLKDHWEKGDAHRVLRERRWKCVVLQDQSQLGTNCYFEGKPHVGSDELFRPFAENWGVEIQDVGAVPIFFLTWARKAAPQDQAALNYAYFHAAKETSSKVAPVGIAWALVREQHPEIDLYVADGSHPSPAGTYLAACTLYAAVFGLDPDGLPAKVGGRPVNLETEKVEPDKTQILIDLPPAEAKILQTAAWTAKRQLDKKGGYLPVTPAPPVSLPALPEGETLSGLNLEGSWTGELLFYPAGPAQMSLLIGREGEVWKGHLEIKHNSKNTPDESFDLGDLKVGERSLTFSIPKSGGVDNLSVSFRGVCPKADDMRGTAEAAQKSGDSPTRLLGTWTIHKAR